MWILYADDEQIPRDLVAKALQAKGYTVSTIDTSRTEEITVRLRDLLEKHGIPTILILDGHHVLHDQEGNKLFDMNTLGMVNWLRHNGLPNDCKFILYSSDDYLIEQARLQHNFGFSEAIPKSGPQGGLGALLQAIAKLQSTN
jgi:hypothetical protein